MRVETLVTCLEYSTSEDLLGSGVLINLSGVFRYLAYRPERFVVYAELRLDGLDATDGIVVTFRCRKPGRRGKNAVWYDSGQELILVGSGRDVFQLPFVVDDIAPPAGRSILQVLVDGRVEAEHVIDFEV
jgi:hypothetical protein